MDKKYNMSFKDAQDFISNLGFDIPSWCDGDVVIDEKNMTQIIANALKWLCDKMEDKIKVAELLDKLPSHIGRNPVYDNENNVIAYMSDNKDGGDMGWLYLHNDGSDWVASYGLQGEYVCMNPDAEEPPYNNAVVYGNTPLDALQRLYDWCQENGFIDNKK